MHSSLRLLQVCRITLFTRQNCGLCATAKTVLSEVHQRRPFILDEIDIVHSPGAQQWRDLYDFDVPVVSAHPDMGSIFIPLALSSHIVAIEASEEWVRIWDQRAFLTSGLQIHVSPTDTGMEDPARASKATKLMHRFTVEQVLAKMDAVAAR